MDKLLIYQKALSLIAEIYRLISDNPQLKSDYSLCDQIRRAVVSILANMAEGYGRSRKQFQNYLQISSGSANETVALLQIINKIYGINTNDLQDEFRYLGRQINSFSRTLH